MIALALTLVSSRAPVWAQAPPATRPGSGPIQITGATLAEYDDTAGVWRMEGTPVVVTRGASVLRMARVRLDERAGHITAEGDVEAMEPGLTLRADRAEVWLADERIRATGAVRVTSTREAQAATLTAPEVEGSLATKRFLARGGVTMTRGEMTATGRQLEYDEGEGLAVLTGSPEVRYREAVITADRVTAWLALEQVRAEGSVRLRRGDLTGSGRRADVRLREQLATLSGAARVERGTDRLEAEEIQVELDRSRATARGNPRLIITPP